MGVRFLADLWQARKRAIVVHFSILLRSQDAGGNCGCFGKTSFQKQVGASQMMRCSGFEPLLIDAIAVF